MGEKYKEIIDILLDKCSDKKDSLHFDILLNPKKYNAENIINDVLNIINIKKYENADLAKIIEGSGVYNCYGNKENRIKILILACDMAFRLRKKYLIGLCKEYSNEQPIFLKYPEIFNLVYNKELVLIKKPKFKGRSVKFGKYICSVVSYNNKHDLLWEFLYNKFPYSNIYIKIDPNDISESTLMSINEEVVRPINIKPFNNEKLLLNGTVFGKYELRKENTSNSIQYAMDYQKGYRVFEVMLKKTHKYFSGIIEEICVENDDLMIGLCIHFDAETRNCDFLKEIEFNHLDGAINIYENKDCVLRSEALLKDKIKASFRSHLFRIEKIPMVYLFEISNIFFNSITLLSDWREDMFKNYISCK